MPNPTQSAPGMMIAFDPNAALANSDARCSDLNDLELARILAARLAIADGQWHRQKSNRNARAREQAAAAIVYLLRNCPEEALPRLQQAVGWLDRSISAPPCPTHGDRRPAPTEGIEG